MRAVLENSSISLAGRVAGKTARLVHSANIFIYGPVALVAIIALLGILIHNR